MIKYNVVSNIGVEPTKHSKLCKKFNQFVESFTFSNLYSVKERERLSLNPFLPSNIKGQRTSWNYHQQFFFHFHKVGEVTILLICEHFFKGYVAIL